MRLGACLLIALVILFGSLIHANHAVTVGRKFCTATSDGDRRDNSPRASGGVNAGAGPQRGKISCLDQQVDVRGVR
jgi:hypothetical protein